jgi:hypothetical protein
LQVAEEEGGALPRVALAEAVQALRDLPAFIHTRTTKNSRKK